MVTSPSGTGAADSIAISALAARVIIGIGRSGNFRKLGVPGEDLDKVYNRLHDPKDYAGKQALVVGGGDSALETAIALTQGGADVILSYRKPEFSRAKPDNQEKIDALKTARGGSDAAAIKSAAEALSTAMSTIGQAMSQNQQQTPPPEPPKDTA